MKKKRKYFPIFDEAVSDIRLCNCSTLNFLIYEENFVFFFISHCIPTPLINPTYLILWSIYVSSIHVSLVFLFMRLSVIFFSLSIKYLKGQCHEIFCFRFFSWISFPQAPDYTIRAVLNFFENLRRYLQLKVFHRSLTPVANGKNLQSEKLLWFILDTFG